MGDGSFAPRRGKEVCPGVFVLAAGEGGRVCRWE